MSEKARRSDFSYNFECSHFEDSVSASAQRFFTEWNTDAETVKA